MRSWRNANAARTRQWKNTKRPWMTIYRNRYTSLFRVNTRTSRPPTIASEICEIPGKPDYFAVRLLRLRRAAHLKGRHSLGNVQIPAWRRNYLVCQKKKQLNGRVKMSAKLNPLPLRRESSCAKKWSISEKASMGLGRLSRRLPLVYPRQGGPV